VVLSQQLEQSTGGSLADVIDRILDKGIVINADIAISVVGVELLGIKIRAAVASFETAARYGLEFPSGTNLEAPGWKRLAEAEAEAGGWPGKVTLDAEEAVPVHVPIGQGGQNGHGTRE
jgi:hypothetical protein